VNLKKDESDVNSLCSNGEAKISIESQNGTIIVILNTDHKVIRMNRYS
jgi:hypothetical protein